MNQRIRTVPIGPQSINQFTNKSVKCGNTAINIQRRRTPRCSEVH